MHNRRIQSLRPLLLVPALVLAAVLAAIAGNLPTTSGTPGSEQDPMRQESSMVPRYACEDDLIEVIFAPELKVRMRGGKAVEITGRSLSAVEAVLGGKGVREWRRSCGIAEERLDEMQAQGEQSTGQEVRNLNNIYRIRLEGKQDLWQLCRELEALAEVEWARPVPRPMRPPMVPPPFDTGQGYLRPASATPVGIDAQYAWTQTGGTGTGVTVCDLEYSWNYNHADITKASGSQINSNVVDPYTDDNHGTAVIGVMCSDNNGWGTTGICYGAALKTCGTYYGSPTPGWNVAGAIALAVAQLDAGDVILVEQQWDYNGVGQYIPIEWWGDVNNQSWNPVFTAIVNAVTNGIHVVETGGNGAYNTDILSWHPNGSGAIIVGAGGAYPGGTYTEGDLQRLSFSSYGGRFDLQGWGEDVFTTGYGDAYNSEGANYAFTKTFAGTSSAAPIVAGAVASCVGRWKGIGGHGRTLTPAILRNILKNTATAQVTPPTGNIGGRPNLQTAFAQIATPPEWNDVTPRILSRYGSIAATSWADYDNDQDFDLFLTMMYDPDSSHLFRNDAGTFTEVTPSNMGTAATGMLGVWGDYDNDGDQDVYISRNDNRANKLYRNNGGGTFTDVSSAPLNDGLSSAGAAWVDYDTDGDLDLCLSQLSSANKLFRNDETSGFVDVGAGPLNDTLQTEMSAWGDYDNDNDPDVYLANFNGPSKLLRNDSGTFTDVTPSALAIASHSYSAEWGDYDNDGDLDLFVAVYWSGLSNKLFRNDGGGAFTDVTPAVMNDWYYTTGCAWADYDNDGDLDLYVTNGASEPNQLYRNDGAGVFVVAYSGALINPLQDLGCYGRGGVWADYDRDGDLDMYLANTYGSSCRSRLFRNEVGDDNHWLQVKAVGTISNKSSIGARVRVVTGGGQQIREITTVSGGWNQSPPLAAFGVGAATTIDSLIVRWPSDTVRILVAVPSDTLIAVYETAASYVCGDADGSGAISISDAVYLINYIFAGGPAPDPLLSGDADCSGAVSISDAVYLINYIFAGGPPPCAACP